MLAFTGFFLLSLVILGVISFAYIAVGASGGFSGGTSQTRRRGLWLKAIAVIYLVLVCLFGSAVFIKATIAAAVILFFGWMVQR